jgi:hypothetical protein
MNIEEMLSTAEGCYEAGGYLSDEDFELHKDRIIESISQTGRWSYGAGRWWKDERFLPFAETLAKGVALEAEFSYEAGRKWSDDRFFPFINIISRGVAQDAERSYHTGHDWPDERFLPSAEIIAKGIAQSSRWSYVAGQVWEDNKFNPVAEIIARGVTNKGPKRCYETQEQWKKERFLKCGDILVGGLSSEFAYDAGKKWGDIVFNKFKEAISRRLTEGYHIRTAMVAWDENRVDYNILAPALSNDVEWSYALTLDEEQFALATPHFPSGSYGNLITMLSVEEKSILKDTFHKSLVNPKSEKAFFDNLGAVLESGSVLSWCEHILDNYEKKPEGIGGDSYERIS